MNRLLHFTNMGDQVSLTKKNEVIPYGRSRDKLHPRLKSTQNRGFFSKMSLIHFVNEISIGIC